MAVSRPVTTHQEMVHIFDRHNMPSNDAETQQHPARLSFLVQDWEGMGGEWVARYIGDSESPPPGTRNLRIYTPDGSLYCYANVSVRPCNQVQWIMDGRPVYFKIKSFGTYTDGRVNPRNGHMESCACDQCT